MNPPTIVPNSGQPPEDDVDGMLRSFFKAEMPNPWPAFQKPTAAPARFSLWRSRLALAASILLLIGGALLLLGGTSPVREQRPELNPSLLTGERTKLPDPVHLAPMK
jgi:hypothetical protein